MRRRSRQIDLVFSRRGGKRKGAGRKRRGFLKRVPHAKREDFKASQPLHVTLRLRERGLRVRSVLRAVAAAIGVVGDRDDFRIVHTSIQDNHLHLACEAASRFALSRGMSSFKTSAARRINRALGRSGAVFADRYHYEVVTTPTQARSMLCYVLNNWRKHRVDRGAKTTIDPFSTGNHFPGWAEGAPRGVAFLPSREPRTWFLREGWKKCRPISVFETPG